MKSAFRASSLNPPVFLSRRQARDVAGAVVVGDREARPESVREWQIDRAFEVASIEVANRHLEVYAELIGRRFRVEPDSTARRVASVQRALRAAQDFDAIEVDELAQQQAVVGNLPDAVDVGADVRDAADRERCSIGAAEIAGDDEVRHYGFQVFHVLDALAFEHVACEGDYRQRHVLQVLLAASRRDDDLFEPALIVLCLPCWLCLLCPRDLRSAGRASRQRGQDRRVQRCPFHESFPRRVRVELRIDHVGQARGDFATASGETLGEVSNVALR